jgi:oxygen-dependent protoporphyrinogen oxidase
MRIAIIGGGIAGLSAAWELEKRRRSGVPLEYRLFEREPRLGGVIQSERLPDGSILEFGPDSFLTQKSWAAALCHELGLADELIASNDAHRRTFILVRNRLRALPPGLQFFIPTRLAPLATSSLFSLRTKLHCAREYLLPPRESGTPDESVAQFVERHFGREMVDRVADPLLSGIYGGRAEELSVRAVLPRMLQIEAQHRSLIRGMLAIRKKQNASAAPAPLFTALKRGMQQMTDAIAAQLNREWLNLNTAVSALELNKDHWHVSSGGKCDIFDAVVLALPAWAAAGLLRGVSPAMTEHLAAIPYTSSITVNLGFDAAAVATIPDGFGFLVPRSEGRRMLACTFVHNKFPNRVPAGRALLRCFFAADGSHSHLLQLTDDQLTVIALRELREILGISAQPDVVRLCRWWRAMPQYSPGHLQRVAEIERLQHDLPGFRLAGNFLRGIGVPDCVRSGGEAAAQLLESAEPAPK